MTEAPSDPQALAEQCAQAMLATDAASAYLGMQLVSTGPGRSELRMSVTANMLNGHGIGHGGFIFSLADSAFAVACNSYNRVTVAAGCDIDFVEAVRQGDVLTAVGVERYRRGRSGLYDITVRRADGTVVAEMRGRAREIGGTLL
ncbi:MAG TPA: hydroxyphenylacetyl-CoA thioesterase PaaI [Jatrophihabitans sp.]|nr:hydroxyphenylacetyl-CoA thioesterase PaaI [Jatrophihabitans sp.]